METVKNNMESVKNNITKMILHTFKLFNYLGYNYKSGDNRVYDNSDKYISSMESGMLSNNDNSGYDANDNSDKYISSMESGMSSNNDDSGYDANDANDANDGYDGYDANDANDGFEY